MSVYKSADKNSRKTRKWQNLLYRKCPNCDSRLNETKDYFSCLNSHPDKQNAGCFFIAKAKAVEYLLNPNHPAHFCLSPNERQNINAIIKTYGTPKEL